MGKLTNSLISKMFARFKCKKYAVWRRSHPLSFRFQMIALSLAWHVTEQIKLRGQNVFLTVILQFNPLITFFDESEHF